MEQWSYCGNENNNDYNFWIEDSKWCSVSLPGLDPIITHLSSQTWQPLSPGEKHRAWLYYVYAIPAPTFSHIWWLVTLFLWLAPLMKTSVLNPAEAQHRAVPAVEYQEAESFDLQPGAFFGWPKLWKDKLKEYVWRSEARSKVMLLRGFLGVEFRKLPFLFDVLSLE